ncbi:MAG: hypothetical protein HRU02_13265 [Myxococcales bacterium]|nr:hypothetical protein [Myxococcales bacterium]
MIDSKPDSVADSDPRRLRALLLRANELAAEHRLHSVVVGMSGFPGDRLFPEFVDYVGSALRIDDAIFRMTRERAVLLLTDVDLDSARAVMERVRGDFCDRFPTARDPAIGLGYFEVDPEFGEVALKQVLPGIFEASAQAH